MNNPIVKVAAALLLSALPVSAALADRLLIQNVDIETMTASGRLSGTDILLVDGRVSAIGDKLPAAGAEVIDGWCGRERDHQRLPAGGRCLQSP